MLLKRSKIPSDWLALTMSGLRDSVPECAQSSAAFAVNQPVTVTTARLAAWRIPAPAPAKSPMLTAPVVIVTATPAEQ